jgi:hypothetical protein
MVGTGSFSVAAGSSLPTVTSYIIRKLPPEFTPYSCYVGFIYFGLSASSMRGKNGTLTDRRADYFGWNSRLIVPITL